MSFCSSKKSRAIVCGIFSLIVLILLDQVIKYVILKSQLIAILCNYGIAMGFILPKTFFVILWTVIIIFVVYFWIQKISDRLVLQLPFILILSGGVSNIIDRIWYGCVIDYIPFLSISSFNFADVLITIGASIIFLQSFKK